MKRPALALALPGFLLIVLAAGLYYFAVTGSFTAAAGMDAGEPAARMIQIAGVAGGIGAVMIVVAVIVRLRRR